MEDLKLMLEVENIFKNKISRTIFNDSDRDEIAKSITINAVYIEIKALAYCFGNIEKAGLYLKDKYLNESSHKYVPNHVIDGLAKTSKKFKKEIVIFSNFLLALQNENNSEVLINNLMQKIN